MSAAFVPGRILLVAALSSVALSTSSTAGPPAAPDEGDFGPICTSGNGGGLGRRGELDGETEP